AGAFLLRQTDQRLNLLPRLAECFLDGRNQDQIKHSIQEMLSQRVYGLALGYEDINDHEQLRNDPVFGILAGREDLDEPLAGKSTLTAIEHSRVAGHDRDRDWDQHEPCRYVRQKNAACSRQAG